MGKKFDLKEVTEEELVALGVSKKIAKEIIKYRAEAGFTVKQDLLKVKTVTQEVYDSIKLSLVLSKQKPPSSSPSPSIPSPSPSPSPSGKKINNKPPSSLSVKGEAKAEVKGEAKEEEVKVDLNKATVEEFKQITVKGFNEKVIKAIVEYREQLQGEGGFQTLSQLRKVPGVGPVLLSLLSPFLFLSPSFSSLPSPSPSPSKKPSSKPLVNNNNNNNNNNSNSNSNIIDNKNNTKGKKKEGEEGKGKKGKGKEGEGEGGEVISVDPRKPPRNVKIASWNLRNFSDKSPARRFSKVALLLSNFHVIALQEIKSITVLDKLLSDYPEYVISEQRVGRNNVTEWYAYIWDDRKVELIDSKMVEDPSNRMSRPPFVGLFKCASFLFALINVHVIYGTVEERGEELKYLAQVVKMTVGKHKKFNKDVLLLGDFNNPPNHPGWKDLASLGYGYTAVLKGEHVSSTIASSDQGNLYDNIWYSEMFTGRNYTGEAHIFDVLPFFAVNDKHLDELQNFKAEVSDHKPIYAEFRTDIDDDVEELLDLANKKLAKMSIS